MEHLQEQQDSLMEKNEISFAEEEQNIIDNNIAQAPIYYHQEDVQEHDQAIWEDLQDSFFSHINPDEIKESHKNDVIRETPEYHKILETFHQEYINILKRPDEENEEHELSLNFENKVHDTLKTLGMTNEHDDLRQDFNKITSKATEEFKLDISNKIADNLTVSVLNNDGTEKTFSIANPNEDSGIKTEEDIIKLRKYIDKEKDNIKEITAKDKQKDNKLSLFDFVKKELNTNEYNSNGERLGEKIIMSLLKPFKIFNNYCNQLEQKHATKITPAKKEELFVKIDDTLYKLTSYSKDFKELNIEDKEGESFKMNNDRSLTFATEPKMDFTSLQMDLLLKGKTIIENSKENLPYKISWKDNAIQFETINTTDFEKNIKSKSISETQTTSKKNNLSL